jgi:hypothetical protein
MKNLLTGAYMEIDYVVLEEMQRLCGKNNYLAIFFGSIGFSVLDLVRSNH